jgi:multidrug efflux pump subunit AcrB
MSSVRIPLGYRYGFLMLALVGLLAGARFLSNGPTTRLPYADTTVITVKWTIAGLNVREMAEDPTVASPLDFALAACGLTVFVAVRASTW